MRVANGVRIGVPPGERIVAVDFSVIGVNKPAPAARLLRPGELLS